MTNAIVTNRLHGNTQEARPLSRTRTQRHEQQVTLSTPIKSVVQRTRDRGGFPTPQPLCEPLHERKTAGVVHAPHVLSVRQVGLDKGKMRIDNNTDYLFIGIGEALRRLFWNVEFSTHGNCFKTFFEPYQRGMGTSADGQTLARGTALLMEQYPNHCFIQDDTENISGTAKRKTSVENILAGPGGRQ